MYFIWHTRIILAFSIILTCQSSDIADTMEFSRADQDPSLSSSRLSPVYDSYYYPKPLSKTTFDPSNGSFDGFTGIISILAMSTFIITAIILIFSGGSFYTFSKSAFISTGRDEKKSLFGGLQGAWDEIMGTLDMPTFLRIVRSLRDITTD
ncbi:uncharacterized protein LOC136037330 isoform X2 [Artemia franciscana]|nr:hypothetical protein QYM36_005371 [Artemia franciscana]